MTYSAIILDQESVAILRNEIKNYDLQEFRFETEQKQPLPHHMTLNMGGLNKGLNDVQANTNAEMQIDAIFLDQELGACAARVVSAKTDSTDLKSTNENPHITCCIKKGTKPFQSNELFDGRECIVKQFSTPIKLTGVVQEC